MSDMPQWYDDQWEERQEQPNFGEGAGGTAGRETQERPLPDDQESIEDIIARRDAERAADRREMLRERAEMEFSWLPDELFRVFRDAWVEYDGSESAALAEMRQDNRYQQYFAGNLRDDGTVRLAEQEYISNIEAYEASFREYGVPGDIVEDRFPDLIENAVRPDQVQDRLSFAYSQIASRSNEVRQFYANMMGLNVSDSAIFSSVIRPDLPLPELEQKVRKAQIGGTASEYDFDIAVNEARRLEQFGLDQQGAQRLYSSAAQQLPRLQELVDRHDDPDDDFSLRDFTDATVMEDADSMRTIQRLFSQESAMYQGGSRFRQDQETGGLRGLRQQ